MREALKRLTLWFATGFGLALGVMSSFLLVDMAKSFAESHQPTKRSNNGQLVTSAIVPNTVTFSAGARVTISNTTKSSTLKPESVDLIITDGGKELFWCPQYITRSIKPGAAITEHFMCEKADRTALPPSVEYKLEIRQVSE